MKYDFIIFGGTGFQGSICARDLLENNYKILLVGRDKSSISNILKNKNASFMKVDLTNYKEIVSAIKKSNPDVVINCAELVFNVQIMKACLETKKPVTDLGGLQKITEQQFKFHKKFQEKEILCLTGCGSTPGIVNVMTAYAVDKLDSVETIKLGFAWNSNIKKFVIPYSMPSIFHEFTEDPVTFHNGKFVREKRARCVGEVNFKEIGKQKVYCIVHSEVYTFSKYFRNKGLKNIHYMAGFPEHSFKVIQTLIDLGFNSEEEIEVSGNKIKIVDFTNKVLKKIKQPKNYREVENIWAEIYGTKNGKDKLVKMNCLVRTLKGWEDAGSNIDTGRTIALISEMIKKGQIKDKGVYAPEAVVPQKLFFNELAKRKMFVYENGKRIN
ncbi:MAG: hypothetical protein KatS3mg001_039 [Candidatus Pacearchaeota archaeon]|nr:MAG: hypothetical protein KatS3mg001_039 [Candidatus Pacearchaeota archaeon]